jgi:hypothetical protein
MDSPIRSDDRMEGAPSWLSSTKSTALESNEWKDLVHTLSARVQRLLQQKRVTFFGDLNEKEKLEFMELLEE